MKNKLLSLTGTLMICVLFTGCGNIKFIEKVESEQSSKVNSEEQFGNIIVDEPSSIISSVTPSITAEDNETSKSSVQETSTEDNVITESTGTFNYSGVDFIKKENNATMWIKEDCPAKTKPAMSSKDYTFLYKGDFVTLTAVSTDEKWAMVSIYGGPSSFVEYKYLSYEEVLAASTQVGELETEEPSVSESTEEEEPTETTTSSEISIDVPVVSSSQQTYIPEPSYEEPSYEPESVDTYEGIAFPSNASSTSFNMGVEFADVTITLTVRKDGTEVSNGPAKPSNASGYSSMATLSQGNTIKCTGIGRNGFVRVEYNGNIGFIDSRYVEY